MNSIFWKFVTLMFYFLFFVLPGEHFKRPCLKVKVVTILCDGKVISGYAVSSSTIHLSVNRVKNVTLATTAQSQCRYSIRSIFDDDVITCKHFARYWPFVRGIHRSPVKLLALCEGNPSVTGEFPSQRPMTRSFDLFSDLHLNKQLGEQSRRRWFETPLRSLWRHCNVQGTRNIYP